MIKKSQIKTSANLVELYPVIINYFQESGFKIQESHDDKLIFTKGSYFTNFVTFDPLSWKSIITIEFNSEITDVKFDIRTFGQVVTGKEIELWDNFILNFEKIINRDSIDESRTNEIKENLDKERDKLIIWSLIGGCLGIIAYLLFKQNSVNFVLIGLYGAIGSLIFTTTYSFLSKKNK